MKVYICFDRYEGDEWYEVFFISTNRDDSIKKCKEETLPRFLTYGPDDAHSFRLVEVEMTEKEYTQLMKWNNDPSQELDDSSSDYFKWMCKLYELVSRSNNRHMILIDTDGSSDYPEIVKYYTIHYKNKDIKTVNKQDWVYSNDYDDYYEELFSDDDLSEKVIKEYVLDTY